MAADDTMDVVLCWHMHQPEYRDLSTGTHQLPWTYLHAIRDYVDMAEHVRQCPGAKAVFNFAPIVLDQIENYVHQVQAFFEDGSQINDPVLAALGMAVMPALEREGRVLIEACLRANQHHTINRFPAYKRLAEIARLMLSHEGAGEYLNNQFLEDLVTWYHLSWIGESVRRENALVQSLQNKERGFTLHERRALLQLIGELLTSVMERYASLATSGQIELSCSALTHPILPLLVDFEAAREALPHASLPGSPRYPGGLERTTCQVRDGQELFFRHFGSRPSGFWPPEGGISSAVLDVLSQQGVQWCATGQRVLRNSLSNKGSPRKAEEERWLYTMYQDKGSGVRIFFRDDELSDLVGFTYSEWHADDAVADLVSRLEKIADSCREDSRPIVAIIMDGENAWEHYPENAWYFLTALYKRLVHHPRLNLTTFGEYINGQHKAQLLETLVAGSWVYGTFGTWIGDNEKNRAWDMLVDAKQVYDDVMTIEWIDSERRRTIDRQLAVCEGSDWFWWLGGYNSEDSVSDFERLFRMHLANLYTLMGREPPDYLSKTLSYGHDTPTKGGVMRRGDDAST